MNTPTHIIPHKGMIYICEPVRKGSHKLQWSAMPQHDTSIADYPIKPRNVPLAVRRIVREASL